MLDEPIEISHGRAPNYSIIWLHGLGADGYDFSPIVSELRLPSQPGIRFIFPHAPMRPVTCNGGMVMRAWYDIVTLSRDARQIDRDGLLASSEAVRGLIAHENRRGVATGNIILAGFSQGGAVAYQTALTHPEPLAGVIALSTYLPDPALLAASPLADGIASMPMFCAHGRHDPVVDIALGCLARDTVRTLGLSPEWHEYPIEHSVCLEEIADISHWIQARLTTG